ncbi:hypothetical protein EDC19_1366 [Natranaerovirga hydrolytica]|uniref:Uncharacterized protein n=1 Tax=Natranaerovirga hydrolytica TaxID=680378 RepID=A0A4R1MK45_9FIRM|nr:hypothetical protein [Natranaerovirga hydrolytica]TCK93178.1 hypothetical protein EDC19_1366 [Natranaerovirga hydrolytica]
MYRIVCESYNNYIQDFSSDKDDYRNKVIGFLRLIININTYEEEKIKCSLDYRKLETFVYRLNKDQSNYSKVSSFLWSLESRGISGVDYNAMTEEEYEEAIKILKMFLNLTYWG